MPRTNEQLEEIREASRERILESAIRLFSEHGYERASVRMIATEAGISLGLLYNYYDGKAALLRAIYERSMRDVDESFRRAVREATPADRIEGLIRAAFQIVGANLPFWRLTYQLRMQRAVVEDLGESVIESSKAILRRLEELLRAIGTPRPDVEARILFAAIDGAAQHYAMDPEHYPLEDVTEALLRRFRSAGSGGNGRESRRRENDDE
jgi:AcrR family transcriptional regulator